MRRSYRILIAIIAVVVVVLGYGYWHAVMHASLYVSVHDKSLGRHGESVKTGTVELLDGAGKLVIRLERDARDGAFHIAYPETYDCHKNERAAAYDATVREAWRACFQRQSRWLADAVPTVAKAHIRFGGCEIRDVAISFKANRSDWFLWWVPLPHIGGKPYSSFWRSFYVNGKSCRLESVY